MNGGWIVIPRWDGPDGFQHYKGRDPIWVKNYRSLLHDDAYLALTFVQRAVLHGLWLEYAASNRQIRDSTSTISRRLSGRVTRETLDALNHAGFIEYSASKPLAPRYQDASPEKKRKEPPSPPSGKFKCPECPTEFTSQTRLADHRYNVHHVEPLRAVS